MSANKRPSYMFMFPYYNEGTFLYISISLIFIAITDFKIQKSLKEYIFQSNTADQVIVVFTVAFIVFFIMDSILNALVERKKYKFELIAGLWFIAYFNIIVGMHAVEFFSAEKMKYFIIFPIINMIHSFIILMVFKYGGDESEKVMIKTYIDETDLHVIEAVFGSILSLLILIWSHYYLQNEWFVTISITITYAAILNKKIYNLVKILFTA